VDCFTKAFGAYFAVFASCSIGMMAGGKLLLLPETVNTLQASIICH
jgi:hypothetical protein